MAAVRATRDCTSCVCLRLRNRCQVLLYAARSTTCDAHYFRAFFPLLIRFACHSRRCEPAGAFCADGCSPCVGLSRTARVSPPPPHPLLRGLRGALGRPVDATRRVAVESLSACYGGDDREAHARQVQLGVATKKSRLFIRL